MYCHHPEPLTEAETKRLRKRERPTLINRLMGLGGAKLPEKQDHMDVYEVTVEQCFVPAELCEGVPLCILDVGGALLILCGQWLYDPQTMNSHGAAFGTWSCSETFFSRFTLRCADTIGLVFQLKPEGTAFIKSQRLSGKVQFKRVRECQFVPGNSLTVVDDLRKAGIIE